MRLCSTLAVAHPSKAVAADGTLQQVSEQAKRAVAIVVQEFSSALKAGDLKAAGAVLAEDVLILESSGAPRPQSAPGIEAAALALPLLASPAVHE